MKRFLLISIFSFLFSFEVYAKAKVNAHDSLFSSWPEGQARPGFASDRLHAFPHEWCEWMMVECKYHFLKEYKGFPKEFHALEPCDQVFYCIWKLEKAGYDFDDHYFYQADKRYKFYYTSDFPEEYFLIPSGERRDAWIYREEMKESKKRAEEAYNEKKKVQNTIANGVGLINPPMGWSLRALFFLD
jgi:hypothetical protein